MLRKALIALALVAALAAPAAAQERELLNAAPGDYIRLLWGLVQMGTNELNLRSLVDDPPKFVLESRSPALGAWSARYVLRNGSAQELALVQFKKDERTRGRDDVLWGEWTIHIKGPSTPDNPDGMLLVLMATHDYVWVRGLSPTSGPQVPAKALPPPPPGPICDSNTREREVDAIDFEFEQWRLTVDEDSRNAYVSCRHDKLKELHDDMLKRNDGLHRPDLHPADAPY